MFKLENPALRRFMDGMGEELTLAQVLIRKTGAGHELRHVEDLAVPRGSLRLVLSKDARSLAQFTANGEFRPLKSAPSLARGWLIEAANSEQLEAVLNGLYPGAVADWLAASAANPPVTHFREFVNRQSGMYRIAAKLTDAQAAEVIRATCAPVACLKRRLWTGADLPPDEPASKSLIPCLEPCALLLETARVTARAAQQAITKLSENEACKNAPKGE